MNKIKALLHSFTLLAGQVTTYFQRRREGSALRELEVERIDRIRHPEKYRGK